ATGTDAVAVQGNIVAPGRTPMPMNAFALATMASLPSRPPRKAKGKTEERRREGGQANTARPMTIVARGLIRDAPDSYVSVPKVFPRGTRFSVNNRGRWIGRDFSLA